MLLDEPTNHLDLEMRQALAVALQDYEGAVVLVSHDRHLLRTVADEFIVVHKGHATPFDGDLEDYAKWLDETGEEAAATPTTQPPALSAESRKQRKRDEAERRNRLTPLKSKIAQHDTELTRLASKSAALQAQLAAPDIYATSSKDKLKELLAQQAQLARETEKVESAWLEASEELEEQTRLLG